MDFHSPFAYAHYDSTRYFNCQRYIWQKIKRVFRKSLGDFYKNFIISGKKMLAFICVQYIIYSIQDSEYRNDTSDEPLTGLSAGPEGVRGRDETYDQTPEPEGIWKSEPGTGRAETPGGRIP